MSKLDLSPLTLHHVRAAAVCKPGRGLAGEPNQLAP